jgi:hypothetical protein
MYEDLENEYVCNKIGYSIMRRWWDIIWWHQSKKDFVFSRKNLRS